MIRGGSGKKRGVGRRRPVVGSFGVADRAGESIGKGAAKSSVEVRVSDSEEVKGSVSAIEGRIGAERF